MNPWPFVVAAYALTLLGTLGLASWSWSAMCRAESQAADLRRDGPEARR